MLCDDYLNIFSILEKKKKKKKAQIENINEIPPTRRN